MLNIAYCLFRSIQPYSTTVFRLNDLWHHTWLCQVVVTILWQHHVLYSRFTPWLM